MIRIIRDDFANLQSWKPETTCRSTSKRGVRAKNHRLPRPGFTVPSSLSFSSSRRFLLGTLEKDERTMALDGNKKTPMRDAYLCYERSIFPLWQLSRNLNLGHWILPSSGQLCQQSWFLLSPLACSQSSSQGATRGLGKSQDRVAFTSRERVQQLDFVLRILRRFQHGYSLAMLCDDPAAVKRGDFY